MVHIQYLFIEIHWRFMSEFQKILQAQSQRTDQQFYQACPFLAEPYDQYPFSQEYDKPSSSSHLVPPDIGLQLTSVHMDNRSQSKSSHIGPDISTGQENNWQVIIPQRQQSQMEAQQQSSQQEYVVTQRRRIQRVTQTYETNNLLPIVKKASYKILGETTRQIIKKLKDSNTASMKDYEELYNIPEFQDHFKEFFKNKMLYRAVMVSRCRMKNKKIFIRKLHIFQKAFRTKIFNGINRKEKQPSRNKVCAYI